MEAITALSALDGRYRKITEDLRDIFSEYGLIKHRVLVEVKWLMFISKELDLVKINEADLKKINSIWENFDIQAALKVKEIEKTTNHDVKAVEYYIKNQLDEMGLGQIKEWVHFACTSDDINNTSYALMLKSGKNKIINELSILLKKVEELALEYKKIPMMSRTHGQPATPTTVGKEMVNFAWRIKREKNLLADCIIEAKMNGATGNYNAHVFAFPDIDWIDAGKKFISQYLDITPVIYTTQINPCNYISQLLHVMVRTSSVVIDMDRDMWGYISLGYFKQKLKEGEVGSSTMPHKVNPIDFENGEGNMGLAIAMMEHMAVKLLNSRFQRDLSDSTVLRSLGSLFGYFQIGVRNTLKGLNKVELSEQVILDDLENNQELLAEPIQTVMRVFDEDNPYEKLKELTRGKKISRNVLDNFIDTLEKVPVDVKERMKKLSVDKYTGLAEKLVDKYFRESES